MPSKLSKDIAEEMQKRLRTEGEDLGVRLTRLGIRQIEFARLCKKSQRLICFYVHGNRRIMPWVWLKLESLEKMPRTKLMQTIVRVRKR